MLNWPLTKRSSPIGIDIGTRGVKLLQFTADFGQVIDAARADIPGGDEPGRGGPTAERIAEAIRQAKQHRAFRGREAVLCLGRQNLSVHNLRISRNAGADLERLVQQEAAGRLPFSLAEAELRYLETADIRQGDAVYREVIVLACHRPELQNLLAGVESAGLEPVAVDIAPNAMLRCYRRQFRRDEDRQQRALVVHVGYGGTVVVIAQGDDALFMKFVDLGGKDFDEAVARHLKMGLAEAAALRRNNGDRRTDQQDPEVAQSISAAVRPAIEKLIAEISLCVRYHSVTFRGQPLVRVVLGGGEASEHLCATIASRLDLPGELCDPLRGAKLTQRIGRLGQWDVAAGLAMREVKKSP